MADVGAAAGVTARTVSNVLSGKVGVRDHTRDAVLQAIKDLGYHMNVSARGLRTGLTGMITLAIPDLGIDYFAQLANTVMSEADSQGWTVIIQQTRARRDIELGILSGAARQLSDGLIFQPHALGPGDERLINGEQPLVLLGDRIFHGPVDHVTMANIDAAAAATTFLLDRGCRRIAVIGANAAGGPVSAAALRLDGYDRALRQAGLKPDPRLIATATEWHQSDGAMATHRLLNSGVPFDGLFCFNDTLAIGAMNVLQSNGLSIPGDVRVIGFDNVPAAAYTYPSLTTIDPGLPQIAKTAVDFLARRISDGAPGNPTEVVSNFSLVARQSA
jgi:DNA-binding LacI/PurR family transcriptional regulator